MTLNLNYLASSAGT